MRTMGRRLRSLALRVGLAALAISGLACAGGPGKARETTGRVARPPDPRWETVVVSARPRGAYLEVRLVGVDVDLTLIFPATELCAETLAPASSATWQQSGHFGYVRGAGGEKCTAVGVASLRAWRATRGPSTALGQPFPPETAHYEVVHRDEEVVQLRGRFPLTYLAAIPGGVDIVAFVPNSEACRRPIEDGEAMLAYRDSGPVSFQLGAACRVTGFARPVRALGAPAVR